MNSGTQTATGDNAIVDMKANTITLSGNVVLSQGDDNVITGDQLIIDMTTGRARVIQVPGSRFAVSSSRTRTRRAARAGDKKGGTSGDKAASPPGTAPAADTTPPTN